MCVWWIADIIKHLIVQLTPSYCYLLSRNTKYSPQHPVLAQFQPMSYVFLLLWETKIHTHTK
jgi:hypothetical protein